MLNGVLVSGQSVHTVLLVVSRKSQNFPNPGVFIARGEWVPLDLGICSRGQNN